MTSLTQRALSLCTRARRSLQGPTFSDTAARAIRDVASLSASTKPSIFQGLNIVVVFEVLRVNEHARRPSHNDVAKP